MTSSLCSNGIPRDQIIKWTNAVALVITSLPESYWVVLHEQIIATLTDLPSQLPSNITNVYTAFNFQQTHNVMSEQTYNYVIALTHATWLHASIGQASLVSM